MSRLLALVLAAVLPTAALADTPRTRRPPAARIKPGRVKPALPTSVPADLAVTWRISGRGEEGRGTVLTLAPSATDAATWTLEAGETSWSGTTTTSTKQLDATAVLALYREIVKRAFFDLKRSYSDDHIIDGYASTMTIVANKQRHSVTVANAHVARYWDVVSALRDLAE